ncbi:hypothetical protein ACFFLM_05160 [Deinococcus oregonensis]|uniref:Uncharacterized protein n=1 Tax=Deinococcus oregonensis TaxID=1805970 RepID=A0ABV6AV31_9DEIO
MLGLLIPPPTLGFEFDVHYGLIREVVDAAGKTMPAIGAQVTSHSDATDGFRVKRDGPRLEIATRPFPVNDAGAKELAATTAGILTFARELGAGCKAAKAQAITVPGVVGQPRPFTHPKSLTAGLPLVRLPVRQQFDPSNCTVWASPQATLTIPLSSVNALVNEIRDSLKVGMALTGGATTRMGLQSEALFRAQRAQPPLSLSDGRVVNTSAFTESLTGFLILLASYLWTSELPHHFAEPKPRDYEPFAKAYLPVNVKAPFSEVFAKLLSADEQLLFREVFALGAARARLFGLARRGAGAADGTRFLFPPGRQELGEASVHRRQKAEFGTVPTWDDLVEHTLNSGHNGWGDRLMVPLSKKIDISKTFPRVALELRRIGFAAMFDRDWERLMKRVFKLVAKLNPSL